MGDAGVYLEKLSAFSRMLHLAGLTVSPQETADASRILTAVGFDDRERVKTALRTVYAKSREEQTIFDRTFDGFFISEEAMRRQAQEQAQKDREIEQNMKDAEKDLQLNGESMDLTEDEQYAYASMPEEERDKLRKFMDRYKDSAQRNPRLYGSFIHSVFAKALLEQQMRMEDAAVGAESLDPEMGLMYREISEFQDAEIPKAISIIQTVSRQINGELTARNRGAGRGRKLDFRRTIRKGLETGGAFTKLKYKPKRKRKKHLVLLCDVSGSMIQFSEFALRFIQSLNQASESSRVFLFSEEMFEADAFSLQNMDLFRNYVRDCGVYGKGTDLGKALEQLNAMTPAALNPSTTLLILSDTKTVDQQKAVAALQTARQKAGKVLWLNPIPERHWRHIRSVQTFASMCTMVSCSTLQSLAAACRKLTLA